MAKGVDFIQLILEGNITPPVKEVKQLSPSVKTVKQYSAHTQKTVKRLIPTQPTRKTTPSPHSHGYQLRSGKFRKQTIRTTCKYCS